MFAWTRRVSLTALFVLLLAAPVCGGQLLVGAADFHARKGVGHFFDPNGWVEGQLSDGGDGCLVAPVRLPHDAVITGVLLQAYDNRAEDFLIALKRKRRGNSVPAETVTSASVTGASTALRQISLPILGAGHLVQDEFVYYLSTELDCLNGPDHRIYAVRIDYELAIFTDGFEAGDTLAWNASPQTVFSAWASAIDFKNYQDWPWTIDTTLAAFWLENGINWTPPCGVAPLELPDGATVVGLLANLWDVRSDRNATLNLRRARMNASTVSEALATATTSGSGGWQLKSDLTIANGTIDNASYWYWIDLCLTGGNQVQAAEIGVQSVQVLYSLP